jgi:hypothetical protein
MASSLWPRNSQSLNWPRLAPRHAGVEVDLKTLGKFVGLSTAVGCASIREVAAEAELGSGFVQRDLGEEELVLRVGIGVEADDDLGPRDRVTYTVVKGVAQFL